MDRRLEELQIIRDQKRKEFDIADKTLDTYKVDLINKELNTNYTRDDLEIFYFTKKCFDSPIDRCVYLNFSQSKCLFCGSEE